MHSGQPIPSHSTTSLRPPSSMESSPNLSNPAILELHSSIPHLKSINDEQVTNVYNNSHHKHPSNYKSKHKTKPKSKLKTTKSKNAKFSKPKYNTLTKPKNLSHQATNSSSSSNTSTTIDNDNSSPDTPPIHPLQHNHSNTPPNNQFEPGYKRWRGQNSIFCNGRIVAGPETKKQIRTLFIILVPVVIYFSTTAVILWRDYDMKYAVIIPIFIFIFVLIFFFIVSCIDPGIIPRPEIYEKSADATDVVNYISRHKHSNNEINKVNFSPPWEQRINIDGNIRIIKYCYTCLHFRPPRSFHCNNCDCCIERFDHHCPWLGNCIAKRNYHFYILFLICINILCIWVGWTSLYIILSPNYTGLNTTQIFIYLWKYNTWPMITICLAIFGIFFPMVLLTFHCYLIATGQTTNEKAKNSFEFVSPYSRGCWGNILEIFCVVSVPISNVHIHHTPPNKLSNEAIVNKKKIVYINSENIKTIGSISSTNEQQKLMKKQVIEEEEEMNSSMDNNNDITPINHTKPIQKYHSSPLHITAGNIVPTVAGEYHDDSHDTTVSGSESVSDSSGDIIISEHNRQKQIRVKKHPHLGIPHTSNKSHHNIGSNSSMESLNNNNNMTYNAVPSKLKRKRGNNIQYNKVHRSQSGYIQAQYHNKKHKNKHKHTHSQSKYIYDKYSHGTHRYKYSHHTPYADAISNPSINRYQHTHSETSANGNHIQSIKSEQIYYNGHGYHNNTTITSSISSGYHPAYYRMQNAHKKTHSNSHNHNNEQFAFSPLSPVHSKDLNDGVPFYPSPQNMTAPIYHHGHGNHANHANHANHGNDQQLQQTQTPILSTNEDNTLTSTYELQHNQKSNKKYRQNTGGSKHSNIHTHYKGTQTTNSTLFSPEYDDDNISSDYYTNGTAPSHAHTYHPNNNNNNNNPFHVHIRPPPPSSVHNNHRYNKYNYNANDILELSNTPNRYDTNGNKKYRKYNHSNGRHKRID